MGEVEGEDEVYVVGRPAHHEDHHHHPEHLHLMMKHEDSDKWKLKLNVNVTHLFGNNITNIIKIQNNKQNCQCNSEKR